MLFRSGREAQKPAGVKGRKRRDRHVEGVSFDTALAKKKKDIRELTVDVLEDEEAAAVPEFPIQRNEPAADAEIPFEEFAGPQTAPGAAPKAAESVPGSWEPEADMPVKEPEQETKAQEAKKDQGAVPGSDVSVPSGAPKPQKAYKLPPITLLKKGKKSGGESDANLRETAIKLQQTLKNFGVNVTVTNVSCGPAVTRYELQPEMGVKVSKIVGLADDIKLNLAAADIRIEAPIPGKAAVGIEVPNKENTAVMLRELLETAEFKKSASKLSFAAGKDIAGKAVVTDIAKMPHVLIAGATGSGKSVCINTLIMSILYKADRKSTRLNSSH